MTLGQEGTTRLFYFRKALPVEVDHHGVKIGVFHCLNPALPPAFFVSLYKNCGSNKLQRLLYRPIREM